METLDAKIQYVSPTSSLLENGNLKLRFENIAPEGQSLVITTWVSEGISQGITAKETYLGSNGEYDLAITAYQKDSVLEFFIEGEPRETEILGNGEKVNLIIIKAAEVCVSTPTVFKIPKPPVVVIQGSGNSFEFLYQKNSVAKEITGDNASTGLVCGINVQNHIAVAINGITGVITNHKSSALYFSKDEGQTATISFLGATMYWNESVAGFSLKPWHIITFFNAYPIDPRFLT